MKYFQKNAQLASIYSQIEFLKNELEEKNFQIHILIIMEGDMHNYILNNINDGDNSVMSSSTDNISVINFIHDDTGNMDVINSIIPDSDDQEIIDEYFNSLYLQYIQD